MKTVSWATKNEVVGRLRIAGMNMKDFAIVEGYQPNTVRKVVSRYAGSKRTPRGALAREILQKLRRKIRMSDVG
ncbi:MAG: hypothetical protein ABSG91_15325 [Syntrophobacteraceae bacterium]|jgi:hypothetical protein